MFTTSPKVKIAVNTKVRVFLSNKEEEKRKGIKLSNLKRPFLMLVTTLLLWGKYLWVHAGEGSLRKQAGIK